MRLPAEDLVMDLADQWCANVGRKVGWAGRSERFQAWPFLPDTPPVLVRHDLVPGVTPVGGPPLVVVPPFESMIVFGNKWEVYGLGEYSYVTAVERLDKFELAERVREVDPEPARRVKEEGGRWYVNVSIFLSRDGAPWVDRRWTTTLDDTGRPEYFQRHNGWGGWDDVDWVSREDLDAPDIRIHAPVVQGVMHALALMNCKNITIDDEGDAPLPRPVRRRRKREGLPTLEFKTLRVEPTTTRRTQRSDPVEPVLPAHVCRGHFKTYTPERPLFGRITGTYWWQDHARGSAEVGTVDKDYEV